MEECPGLGCEVAACSCVVSRTTTSLLDIQHLTDLQPLPREICPSVVTIFQRHQRPTVLEKYRTVTSPLLPIPTISYSDGANASSPIPNRRNTLIAVITGSTLSCLGNSASTTDQSIEARVLRALRYGRSAPHDPTQDRLRAQ